MAGAVSRMSAKDSKSHDANSVTTDRAALSALGLSEQEAARILGRRRQALNAALGKNSGRAGYFSVAELLVLCLAAKGRGRQVNEQTLAAYIERNIGPVDGPQAAKDFLTGFGSFGPPDLGHFQEVWVVLPDFLRLRSGLGSRASELKEIPARTQARRVVYLCGSSIHRDALKAFLGLDDDQDKSGEHARILVIADSLISAQMTSLIGNPLSSNPQVFAMTNTGFLGVPYVDAAVLAEYLKQRISRLEQLPPLSLENDRMQVTA